MYEPCSRYKGNVKYTCFKLDGLKSWLYEYNGLDLKSYFQKRVEENSKEINYNSKYQKILKTLYDMGIGKGDRYRVIHKTKHGYFSPRLITTLLVDDEGEWSPINKINTNWSDVAEIITDSLIKSGEIEEAYSLTNNTEEFKKFLNNKKSELQENIGKNFVSIWDLLEYTKNVEEKSRKGKESEEFVKGVLLKMGFELTYQGGDGDLIDMIYGSDLIMSWGGSNYLIQVKTSQNDLDEAIKNRNYRWVDMFISPLKNRDDNEGYYGIKIMDREKTHFYDTEGKEMR